MNYRKVLSLRSLIAAAVAAASLTLLNAAAADPVTGAGKVTRVVDGDTYWVQVADPGVYRDLVVSAGGNESSAIRNGRMKIRLLNIDTEESVHPKRERNTAFGKHTSKWVKAHLTGQAVQFSCDGVGRYGRPLCTLATAQGDWGEQLIRAGFSPYYTKYGKHADHAMHTRYLAAEAAARAERLGVWE